MDLEDHPAAIAAAQNDVIAAGLLRPLEETDRSPRKLFLYMDLCSMVEGAFGVQLDPLTLSGDDYRSWLDRRCESLPSLLRLRGWLLVQLLTERH